MSSWKKSHNLCVKTGTFTDREGNEKNRYERIGYILRGPKAEDRMLCINRTFNPAGVPAEDGRDTVIVYAFEESDREERRETAGRARQGRRERVEDVDTTGDFDDSIPF